MVQAEEIEQLTTRDSEQVAAEQALWRQRGSFGKFHNVVKFIRASPQRRQEFQAVVEMIVSQREVRSKSDVVEDLNRVSVEFPNRAFFRQSFLI